MTVSLKLAVVAMLVSLAAQPIVAQDFGQLFKNKAATPATSGDDVANAVYATLGDMQGSANNVSMAAYESINDTTRQPVTANLSDRNVTSIPTSAGVGDMLSGLNDGGVAQATLLGPACGLPGGPSCGLPGGPSCGLPGPTCGLPGGGCDSCGGCGEVACGSLMTRACPDCCGVGTHYSRVYGDALYMRARGAEVAYAVPIDGPIVAGQTSPIQVGNVGIIDSDYDLAFRAGFNIALDTVSSIDARYTLFQSVTENETSAIAPFALRSLVTHPSSATASQDALAATANLDIDFELVDVAYRHLLKCCDTSAINYVVGARYASLDQQFDVSYVKLGTENVSTDIDFDGAGIRLGLETERYSCRHNLHVYANGYASLLAGRIRAQYFQGQSFDPSVVNSEWEAGRIVPVMDVEAGVGWTSSNGKLRMTAGYMVSAWFNTITTQEYVNAIQTNSFLDMSDTMWFDGLQARVSCSF